VGATWMDTRPHVLRVGLVLLACGTTTAVPAGNNTWAETTPQLPSLPGGWYSWVEQVWNTRASRRLDMVTPMERKQAQCPGEAPADATRLLSPCMMGHAVPKLQIIGCMKCGTTSLHKELTTRAGRALDTGRVLAGEFWFTKKEKHFFDRNETYGRGMRWYLSHFSPCEGAAKLLSTVAVDATQAYSKMSLVPQRMHQSFGSESSGIHFVMVLRDPVLRLFSNYFHRKKCCLGDITFDRWVDDQLQAAELCTAKHIHPWPTCGEEGLFAGLYSAQLRGYLQHFCASQFVLVAFNGLIADGGTVMTRILQRVGVSRAKGLNLRQTQGQDVTMIRKNGKTPSDQSMVSSTHSRLAEFYRPHNLEVLDLVRDYPAFTVLPTMMSLEKELSDQRG